MESLLGETQVHQIHWDLDNTLRIRMEEASYAQGGPTRESPVSLDRVSQALEGVRVAIERGV
jgi:hypothetical protein